MTIACDWYRIASVPDHHRLRFEAAKPAVGKQAAHLVAYFDSCPRKRNQIDYTGATIATGTEAEELLLPTNALVTLVEEWIEADHPAFGK